MISLKKVDWKGTAELVGLAAIVVSLIFVGLQMRQDQEIAEAQAYNDASAVLIELNQFIHNNKEVWIKGLDGAELSLADELTFHVLCRTIYLKQIASWERAKRLDAGNPDFFAQSYAYDIHIYPGLRRFFDQVIESLEERRRPFGRTRGDDTFTSAVEAFLAELDRNPPPPPRIKSYYVN